MESNFDIFGDIDSLKNNEEEYEEVIYLTIINRKKYKNFNLCTIGIVKDNGILPLYNETFKNNEEIYSFMNTHNPSIDHKKTFKIVPYKNIKNKNLLNA